MLEGAVPNTRGQMIRYLFLIKHLDLEYMRRHCTSLLIHFGFHFYTVLQVCFWESGALHPLTHNPFLNEEKVWFLLFLLFRKPYFGACIYIGSISACSDAMYLRGGDLIVTKVAAKRGKCVK